MQAHLLAASQLDRKLDSLQIAATTLAQATPSGGWIRAIRRALGMTSRALGKRAGLAQQSVVQLEESEHRGTITLASLRRMAAALDADVVYALVPRKPLAETVTARARGLALERVRTVAQTMNLEAQTLSNDQIQAQIVELTRELERRPRELWR